MTAMTELTARHKPTLLTTPQATKLGWFIIQHISKDKGWENTLPEDVPDWIKHQDVMANLAQGILVCNGEGDSQIWYRAVPCEPPVQH